MEWKLVYIFNILVNSEIHSKLISQSDQDKCSTTFYLMKDKQTDSSGNHEILKSSEENNSKITNPKYAYFN